MSNDVMVGSTGFVGGNLLARHSFALALHSSNIGRAFGSHPELLVYAGVPSAMFLANSNPDADLAIMREARENIRRIKARQVVLISTIAVYADSRGKDECAETPAEGLPAYGRNRLQLEQWVRDDFSDALIVRLPALYGDGLKKNFVRDLISVAPPLLSEKKYSELSSLSALVSLSYRSRGDGFFEIAPEAEKLALKEWFSNSGFNALSFTDSRSRFQFYNLKRLWNDIELSLNEVRKLVNLCPPPVSAGDVFEYVRGRSWTNELNVAPFDYDMRSRFTPLPNGGSGYFCSREDVLSDLKRFVMREDGLL